MNARTVFLAAPLLTFAYGVIRIIDGLDGSRGPGLAWTTGHLAFMAAVIMFLFAFGHLHRLAGRDALSTVTVAVASAGGLALFTQFGIDVVAGLMADDRLGMSEIIRGVRGNPVVSLLVYDVGPYLFYVGLLGLVIRLAVARRVAAWTPVLVLFDLAMPQIDKDLIPVGAAVLLVSFISIAKRIPVATTPAPALV